MIDDLGRVLLLGASGGVGTAVASRLLDLGYEVVGSVLDETQLATTRESLSKPADLFVADFSNTDLGAQQIAEALSHSGSPLAAVIGCVGVNPCGDLETTSLHEFRRTMEINTVANLAAYQKAIPLLRQSGGRAIFVSSLAGKVAMPLLGHYVASKFALEGLADVMRLEAGQWGIPVSLIEPGGIATDMVSGFARALDARLGILDSEGRKNYGAYFEQHQAFTAGALEACVSPADVAELVLKVLQEQDPEPRYGIGNALEFLAMRKTLSDREFDALLRGIMPGSSVLSSERTA